jgi:hypothetical protein
VNELASNKSQSEPRPIQGHGGFLGVPLLILPAIYVVDIFLTAVISAGTPGGAYYRIVGIGPVAGAVGMVYDSTAVIVIAFLLSGTPWWYLIGWIGWNSRKRRTSRGSSGLGAIIALFTCFVSTSITLGNLKQDIHDKLLTSGVIFQYSLAVLLIFGALISTFYAIMATLDSSS